MNMKNIFCCLLPGLLFGACSNKVYEETGDSVIVKVGTILVIASVALVQQKLEKGK